MKRLAKSPKTAFRTGRGELGELGGCARSASWSAGPSFVARVRSTSCWRTVAICDAISVAFSGVIEAWRSEISWFRRSRVLFTCLLLLTPLAGQERGRDPVRDRRRATGCVVGADDVDHVRVLVDARGHLVAQRLDGLSGEPVLRRRGEQLAASSAGRAPSRGRAGSTAASEDARDWADGLSTSFEVAWYVLGRSREITNTAAVKNDDDRRDQPAAALERVEIAPDFHRIVRREPRRGVSSNAFVPDSRVRHGS